MWTMTVYLDTRPTSDRYRLLQLLVLVKLLIIGEPSLIDPDLTGFVLCFINVLSMWTVEWKANLCSSVFNAIPIKSSDSGVL